MTGRHHFSAEEAQEIRRLLSRLRLAERQEQKKIRGRLRRIGFRISDFAADQAGFTRSDFDDLVQRGLVAIEADEDPPSARGQPTPEKSPRTREVREELDAGLADAIEEAAVKLSPPGWSIDDAERELANAPGLYAVHADPKVWEELALGLPPDDRPLYVGKAESSLIARDIRTHFADGRTGQSTLRRSFAALLRDQFDLVATPRNPAKPERFANYGLEVDGDSKLTHWMRANLRLAGWERRGDASLLIVEGSLLHRWEPPLNLKDVTTPWSSEVRAARARMAQDAREWAEDRGSSI